MTATDGSLAAPLGESGIPEALAAMIEGLAPTRLEPGAPLMRQGEKSEEAFVITEGTVRIVADTAYGAVPLATINGPKLIGEIGALSTLPRTASVIAVTALTVYLIPRSRLIEFGRENPQFLTSVITELGKQLDGMNRTLSLYSNALAALESREFDTRILDDLANPSPQMAEFSAAFRKFAQEIVGKRRRQDELASAAIIQQSYLPQHAALAGAEDALELHAKMRPARNVGGDFYDFFFLDDGRLAIAVGDVCGKGIPASLFMAVVMTVLRVSAREVSNPQAMLARANAVLSKDNTTTMFATLFYGVLNLDDGTLEYCNCGHNAPIILGGDGSISTLSETGLPLALFPDRSAEARTVKLSASDLLVMFTDGVTEAMSPVKEEFSDQRLQETIRAARDLDTEQVVARIFGEVDDFAQDAEQADDITCVAVRCSPRSLKR
jgi:serine phosphatase RsbU (regulator of sigma subunit)